MDCRRLLFSRHAVARMFERELNEPDIATVIGNGDVIREYPDDRPYPSTLMLGFKGSTPVHVVVAKDGKDGTCYVITVYVPDSTLWSPDFRKRRNP